MTTVPVRGLAEKGILHDPSPYQLDLNAWSGGLNVRFHANKAERAPIFRTLIATVAEEPVFCVGLEVAPTVGYDTIITAGSDGRVWQYGAGSLTAITEVGHTNNTDPRAYTSTYLGGVLYLNRPDQAPRYLPVAGAPLVNLPNMETTWTCRTLRAFGDYLVALNVTKPSSYVDPYTGITLQGGSFSNMFKWSDLTLEGLPPDGWDPDNPNLSSGENPLEELNTPIVDGCNLRSIFVIYSENQVWAAQQNGAISVFNFYKLFDEGGMLAPNCAVEVNGVHYVFGPKDIYKHDGVSKVSIVDKRNREFIFRNLNIQKSEVCFVSYLPQLDEVWFCYNSGDPNLTFQNCDRCNCAAVYDISADTWTFRDLPNVSAVSQANVDSILTWQNAPSTLTWANVGGSWYDQENTYVKNVVLCSAACSGTHTGVITANRLMAYDFNDKGSLAFPYEPECNAPAYLERTGIALDQMGSDLTTYKKIRRMFPLVYVYENTPMLIEVGGSNTPAGPVTYSTSVMFDPVADYKMDLIMGGRYLAVRFTVSGPQDFEVSGYDVDVTSGGRR